MARRHPWQFLIALAIWSASSIVTHAQAPSWRFFKRDTDGLPNTPPTSLSFSPRGNLWISHEDGQAITQFDGYRFLTMPAPDGRAFRIYEGMGGQLWAIDLAGLHFHDGNGWQAHPIAEIAQEIQSKPARLVRQIPLLPAERHSVLVLLGDRLLKYDALQRNTTVLRLSDSAGIGTFSEMISTADESIWITGESGAARIPQALRQLGANAKWEMFPLDESLPVKGLRSPVDDGRGGIVALADSRLGNRRVLAKLRDGRWTLEATPVDGLRHAWHSLDGRTWGLDVNTLHQWLTPDGETRTMDDLGILPGNFSDISFERDGAFWLSTPEGLWRYAPPVWRAPKDAPATTESIGAIHELEDGTLYFLGRTELLSLSGDTWKRHPLPVSTNAPLGLGTLTDGRIFYTDARGVVTLDPAKDSFERHSAPDGATVRYLGKTSDQLHFRAADSTTNQVLLTFDGRDWQAADLGILPQDIGGWSAFFMTSADETWLGGTFGAAVYRAGNWTSFIIGESQRPADIRVFAELSPGTIWLGGGDRLLAWDGRYLNDLKADTESVNQIVTTQDGTAWIATDNGLHRRFAQEWLALSAAEGVPGAVLAFHEDRAGRRWIGHHRGLARFHTETDTDPPQTFITEAPTNKQITEPVFTISFSGRDRWNAAPVGRLLFSYRIDAGEWSSYTLATRVTLAASALKAGDRLFEVRAMDRHLNVDPRPAIWQFTIMVPWFKDPRLMGMTVLAALAVLVFAGLAVNRHLKLRRSHAAIERIVEERTHQLAVANRELAHAEKMRSLGTLAAGVAHDFNSILSIIRGSTQIIEANPDNPEKIQTRLSRIKSMVEQGSTLVKAMLGFSRADDAELFLENVSEVVTATMPLLGDRLPAEVTVVVNAAADLPVVHGSRELLQQILLNLVLNACDAMESRGQLTLDCHRLHGLPAHQSLPAAQAAEYIAVGVADTGCGISPENLSRIFEPFFTTKAFSTRHGTGLGLSMVYEFCKELGYGLSVRSELNRGTTFTIIIPVHESKSAKA